MLTLLAIRCSLWITVAYKFVILDYVDNNSKLLSRIYQKVGKHDKVLLRGYYDFNREGYYIESIEKGANVDSLMKFLMNTLNGRFCWEYSNNYDVKLYQEWLRVHAVFNKL